MRFARIDAAADRQTLGQMPKLRLNLGHRRGHRRTEGQRVPLHHLRDFGPAPIGILPTAHQHHPVQHEHAQQFGIPFTQQPPRLLAARLVDVPVTFPQLEEQFDVPAHPQQDERLRHRQLVLRYGRHTSSNPPRSTPGR